MTQSRAWLPALWRYLATLALGNLAWEIAQLQLYTLWRTLPGLGAGLVPLAQWVVVPVLAFMGMFARLHALERPPARLSSDEGDTRVDDGPKNAGTHLT